VEAVDEGSEERFAALRSATAPKVLYYAEDDDDSSIGCGCAGSDAALKGGGRSDTANAFGVDVVASGYAGSFQYTVLEASDADALVSWLQERGYDTSVSAPSIAAYVEDEVPFAFVAVQLAPDAPTTPEGGVALNPLRIRYSAGADGALHLTYPARMALTSMLPEVRTELYVLGSGRAMLGGGWTEEPRDDGEVQLEARTFEQGAEDAYADHLRSVGGTNARMFPVSGGMVQDSVLGTTYVTRFDAIVTPATNTADATFTVGSETPQFSTSVIVDDPSVDTAGVWLLPLGLGGWTLRRRRDRA
jgi:hypothetical protein